MSQALLGPRSLWLLCLVLASAGSVDAGQLRVRVADARSGRPISGAFVQVGEAPGEPFADNWGYAGADGRTAFDDALLVGPQTITAASPGYVVLTVFRAALDSLTLLLHEEVADSALPEPRAEISGTVTGITIQSNDGQLDLGIVYPAVGLSDILSSRVLPFEVPSDTVSFPVVGEIVMPGNVVLPSQTEFYFFNFSKPRYHVLVADSSTYDFWVLSGRLPVESLGSGDLPLNDIVMRKIGAERARPVAGDLVLDLHTDLNLQRSLTVTVPEAPAGAEVFVAAVADLPTSLGGRSLFYDAKTALADTLGSFLLAGRNPIGDLLDAVPYVAGYYADSSGADLFQAGRVDRAPLTLPASRALDRFYLLPRLSQVGDLWQWSDVAVPGLTPDPTWALSTFRLEAVVPGDPGVTPRTLWEVWVPADRREFRLPVLAGGGPGGLPDPGQSPENDRLLWDCWLADPAGEIRQVLADAFGSLTRWSRATIEITPPILDVEEFGLGTLPGRALRFRLAPNPGPHPRDVLWDGAPDSGQWVSWTVVAPNGRRLSTGRFRASGSARDAGALEDVGRLPTGVYWVRLQSANRFGSIPLVILR